MKKLRNLTMALIGIASTSLTFMSFQSKPNKAAIGESIAVKGDVTGNESMALASFRIKNEPCWWYGYNCPNIVIKCRPDAFIPCDPSDQIPCSELCAC